MKKIVSAEAPKRVREGVRSRIRVIRGSASSPVIRVYSCPFVVIGGKILKFSLNRVEEIE